MNNVSKNIKKFRCNLNMTQEALAEKITVTRQAVSNWENGRTEPDLDMLISVAAALGTTTEELIYGKKIIEEKRGVRLYKRLAIICGAFTLVSAVLLMLFAPTIREYKATTYDTSPEFYLSFIWIPLTIYAVVICFLSLFSFKADIHIKNNAVRICILSLGIVISLICFAPMALLWCGSLNIDLLSDFLRIPIIYYIISNQYTRIIPPVLIYFGLIKK